MEHIKHYGSIVLEKFVQVIVIICVLGGFGVFVGLYSKIIQFGFRFGWNLL